MTNSEEEIWIQIKTQIICSRITAKYFCMTMGFSRITVPHQFCKTGDKDWKQNNLRKPDFQRAKEEYQKNRKRKDLEV
jgi:hypothetical protein